MTEYLKSIRRHLLDRENFVRATFSGRQRGHDQPWQKVTVRPVEIQGQYHLQMIFYDEKKSYTHNYAATDMPGQMDDLLALPFRNYHLTTRSESLQINLSKRGKPMTSRTPHETPVEPDLSHDRQKQVVLSDGDDVAFLRILGLTDAANNVRRSQRDKFKQIQAFLQILSNMDAVDDLPDAPTVVDFGCGSAYLTLATYYYLRDILNKTPRVIGVDINPELQQRNQERVQELGWQQIEFVTAPITDYSGESADMVLALHACDTASDDALAQAIRFQSEVVLVAPCCHHHLQAALNERPTPETFAPVMRYGLMHERMGDIITDTFRTQILKLFGYQVDVLEFVMADHTPKNLLIRARYTGHSHAIHRREYARLRDYWGVEPYLHTLLKPEIDALFAMIESND